METLETRKYYQAWEQLKKYKSIIISAHPKLHPRILKAVVKEKNMDIVYKLELSDNLQKSRIAHSSEGFKLTITMHLSIGLDDFH